MHVLRFNISQGHDRAFLAAAKEGAARLAKQLVTMRQDRALDYVVNGGFVFAGPDPKDSKDAALLDAMPFVQSFGFPYTTRSAFTNRYWRISAGLEPPKALDERIAQLGRPPQVQGVCTLDIDDKIGGTQQVERVEVSSSARGALATAVKAVVDGYIEAHHKELDDAGKVSRSFLTRGWDSLSCPATIKVQIFED